jgi:hypothetical protein
MGHSKMSAAGRGSALTGAHPPTMAVLSPMVCAATLCFCNEKDLEVCQFLNRETGQVRHLLIDEFGGHEHTDLILVTAATEEKIFSGTLYESVQKAHEMGQSWAKGEGLESAREDQPPYEPLAHAGKLVMLLDHDAISDPT